LSIVLDANVLVSALLRTGGPPGRVLDLAVGGQIILALDDRIVSEYADVLLRRAFGFSRRSVLDLLDLLGRASERVTPSPIPLRLPDPDDARFLEVTVSAGATALVTGNIRHHPAPQRHGVRVMTPREWLTVWVRGGS